MTRRPPGPFFRAMCSAFSLASAPLETKDTWQSAGGTSDTGNAAVDKYCNDIAALADEIAKVKADPTKGDLQALGQKSQDIAGQATALAGEVMKDPSLGAKIQECTKQLDAANS